MNPAAHLALFVAFVAVVAFGGPKIRRWWRKGCDGCRTEDLGGAHTPASNVVHTCFPWRNPYRNRKGELKVFGKVVKTGPNEPD